MANKKISQLPASSAPFDRTTKAIPIVQGGVTDKISAEELCGIYRAKITLTSAQILAIGVTPILAIAAPGAGYAIRVIAMTGHNHYNTTPYATHTTLVAKTDTATRPQFSFAYLLSATSDSIELGVLQDFSSASSSQLIENKAVYLQEFSGSNPTAGDSDVDVFLTYEILAL